MKKVDEYHLHELITVVLTGAERPDPSEIRKQITAIMAFEFEWKETAATNQERLSAAIAKVDAFGIEIRNDLKATIILANVASAARADSGGTEIREAMRKIKAKYPYDHPHDENSIKMIMIKLATADEQRDRTNVPSLTNTANLVTARLQEMVTGGYSTSEGESVMTATSRSGSSSDGRKFMEKASRERKGRHTVERRLSRTNMTSSPAKLTRGKYESPQRTRSPSPANMRRGRYESPPRGKY